MKSFKFLLVLSLLFSSVYAQDGSPITKTTDNKTYVNEYFDIEITKPQDWYVQPPEMTLKMGKIGSKMLAGDDKNMQVMFEQSLDSVTPLFTFFRYPPGTPGKKNINMIAMAENVSLYPGIKNGCDYLHNTKEALKNSEVEIDISDECVFKKINSNRFGQFDLSMNINGVIVKQVYNACISNDHAIAIAYTYFDDEEKKILTDILNTLKIKCNN